MKLLFLFPLLFFGCNTPAPPAKNAPVVTAPVQSVKSIQVVTQGGQLGYFSACTITEDSVVHQSSLAVDSTKNEYSARKTAAAEWQLLVESIDVAEFKAAQNGRSEQPVDGTDTEITITTSTESISKTNAAGSATWTGIEMWSGKNCR